MNKTISIHLGGAVFNIEEDAFNALKNYLDRIQANFSGDSSSAEIMADIESRIAELFAQRMDERKNVVVLEDVDHIISVMGKPEDYAVDGAETQSQTKAEYSNSRNRNRKVFRDREDAIVGGVCAGLSHYFGWDPLVIRLIVCAIFFISGGTAILGYIIFWAVVPVAETTAEKLQMRGEPVNIDNIHRHINEEARLAAEKIGKFGSRASRDIRNGSYEFFGVIGRVFSILVGLFLLFFGLGLLTLLVIGFVAADANYFGNSNWSVFQHLFFGEDSLLWTTIVGVILALTAPAVALIYSSIRLLTGSRGRVRGLSVSLLALFIIGVILCFAGGMQIATEFKSEAELTSALEPTKALGDTLYITVPDDAIFKGRKHEHNREFFDYIRLEKDSVFYGSQVYLDFESSNDSTFAIKTIRKCRGQNLQQAAQYASNIQYVATLNGNVLEVPSLFTTPAQDKFRGQEIFVTVTVPNGKYVHFGNNISYVSWHEDFDNQTKHMLNDEWEEELEEEKLDN